MSEAVPSRLIPGATELTLRTSGLAFTAHEIGAGPLVLLIHGFPDGPATWRDVAPRVAEAGFRCVAVTLRGYQATSLSPEGQYRLADLAGDVASWIEGLGEQQAHLIGHDWGATIAFAAAVYQPERVVSLSMISVPNPMRFGTAVGQDKAQMKRSSYIMFFQLGGLSDWWVGRRNAAFVERLWRKWSPGWTPDPTALSDARSRFSVRSVRSAALAYYRQALDRSAAAGPSHALLAGTVQCPVLGLIGENDQCISADIFRTSMVQDDFPGGMTVGTVSGAGHFVQLERAAEVAERLVTFLTTSTRSG